MSNGYCKSRLSIWRIFEKALLEVNLLKNYAPNCKQIWLDKLMLLTVVAGKMLGQILVTKQTGPQGKVVSKVRVSYDHSLC